MLFSLIVKILVFSLPLFQSTSPNILIRYFITIINTLIDLLDPLFLSFCLYHASDVLKISSCTPTWFVSFDYISTSISLLTSIERQDTIIWPSNPYAQANERPERQHSLLSLQHHCLHHITSVSLRARAHSRSCAFGYSSSSNSNSSSSNRSNGKNSLVPRTHIRLFFFFLVVMMKHIKNRLDVLRFFSPSLPSTQPVSKFSFASQTSSQEIKPFFLLLLLLA